MKELIQALYKFIKNNYQESYVATYISTIIGAFFSILSILVMIISILAPFIISRKRKTNKSKKTKMLDDLASVPKHETNLIEKSTIEERVNSLRTKKAQKEKEYNLQKSRGATKKQLDNISREIEEINRSLSINLFKEGDVLKDKKEEVDVFGDRYILKKSINAGGFASVWKALDMWHNDNEVAVKILYPQYINDDTIVTRFFTGARVMNSLKTCKEGVVAVLNVGRKIPYTYYYVMEFIDGSNLEEIVKDPHVDTNKLFNIIFSVGETLRFVHKEGYFHRDINPSNILLDKEYKPKLTDFDCVKQSTKIKTFQTVGMIGFTPIYSPMELLRNPSEADERTDIYGLAVTAIFIIFGKSFPPKVNPTSIKFIENLPCNSDIQKVLGLATEEDICIRYHTMENFLKALWRAKGNTLEALPNKQLFLNQENKIKTILFNSFCGTLLTIFFIRFFITCIGESGMAHLSDRKAVALFHALIGSSLWGTLIPFCIIFAFLKWYWSSKRLFTKIILSLFSGGIGGLVGGLLCAFPSVLVTNGEVLKKLNWIVDAGNDDILRLMESIIKTKFFFAFPITGTFTGIGLGIFIFVKLHKLGLKSSINKFSLPQFMQDNKQNTIKNFFTFITRPWWLSFCFLIPISSVFLQIIVLDAQQDTLLWGLSKNIFWRSVGEGIVHAIGSIGLVIGFFWSIDKKI